MSLDDEMRRAEHAKTILGDELVQEAFNQMQVQLVANWIATEAGQQVEREAIWHRLQSSLNFKEYFERLVEGGKHAAMRAEADKRETI